MVSQASVSSAAPSDQFQATQNAGDLGITSAITVTPEDALAVALERASAAGQWSVVAMLAKELEARRLAGGNVVTLDAKKGGAK